jgi:hypothetical protein
MVAAITGEASPESTRPKAADLIAVMKGFLV